MAIDITPDGFIQAACVPLNTGHSSGVLDAANAILAAHPQVAGSSIHTAAILGDEATVRRFLSLDPASATATGGPRGWDAITHLCFSLFLQHDRSRSDGFVRTARALLDAGASALSGWWEKNHQPKPEWESVLYGAAGIAHHPELTQLLLDHGADPNDGETCYHSPESYDNRALQALVNTGRVTPDNLVMMLVRKHDWHDYEGAKWLLEHGTDPNQARDRGWNPLHHALARDNSLEMIALLLDHGADTTITEHGLSAAARAAYEGRSDVLGLFRQRGIPVELTGLDRLVAACAMGDPAAVRPIADADPGRVPELLAMGGTLLGRFAGTNNAPGVERLLDLGVDVATPYAEGDGYWGEPRNSLAIHVAAWRGRPAVVKVLLAHGSPVDAPDANGRTPLMLAVKACVDTYWTERRTPDSVRMLLEAGASAARVPVDSGYADVDELLRKYR